MQRSFSRAPGALGQIRRLAPEHPHVGVVAVVALVAVGALLVYLTGGTARAFPDLLYLPIAVGAYLFGLRGGILAALLSGLALGPAMPHSVPTGEAQEAVDWLSRLGFYLVGGIAMGAICAVLHERRTRIEEAVGTLEETHSATLKAFTSVVEVHDGATGEHCERVAANARALGLALGLGERELDQLYWAGILHDVGKVAVPATVIQKPGALSDEEYELVKQHPVFGANLLRAITDAFEPVAVGVESHHERWNGSGYPKGLAGEEIPLFGRILAIVDVFEALTSDRPYRGAVRPDDALMMLRNGAGSLYDWKMVALYESLYWDGHVQVAGQPAETVAAAAKLTTWLTKVEG